MLREVLIGIFGGTLSGVFPGIHVNTLAVFLTKMENRDNLLLFSMGVTHTFLDVIPSAFLGVPDEGTALGVLPAHRLVMEGRGGEVIRIALWASFLAVVFVFPLALIYPHLARAYSPSFGRVFVLLLASFLILTEKGFGKLYALLVFVLSGVLGIITFRLLLDHPYYHLFTGLFGIPVLVVAAKGDSGRVEFGNVDLRMKLSAFIEFSFLGTILGMISSLVPAFTSSQAALLGSFISRDERSFLTIVFSVNTANFLFSFLNFYETGRVRNGVVALMSPPLKSIYLYLLTAVFVSLIVLLYGEYLAKGVLVVISSLPYSFLNSLIVILLMVLSAVFDGFRGVMVILGASLIGLLAQTLGVKRTNCMGVLMLPIIIG